MAITAGFFLGSTSGVAITTSVWLTTSYVGMALTSLATSLLLGALSPKPAAAAQRGYETNVLGAGLDHTIIYGKTKVGGVVVYNEATGTDNKFLHRIIAVAGHEVESFDRIYIDDAHIDFSDLGASGNVGTVVDQDDTTSDRYNGKLRIQVAYGTPTQAANADLVTQSDGLWTASHKLSGIAYIYVRLAFDADVYPNGIPTFTAEVKGKKVFDPRTNTTGWSDNPALCVRDYLTSTYYDLDESGQRLGRPTVQSYGLGDAQDNIDDSLVMAAADVCDQTVSGKTRYTTNGSFTTGATPYDLISSILPSMGGSLWYAQGKWRMKPAYWTTPVMFLDEDDLRSSISVSTRHSRRDNFNVIKGKFSGPDTNWQTVDYKEVRNRSDAGTFVTGLPYSISELGNTNWFAVGANLAAEVGDVFTATGAGSGTGVADLNLGVDNGLTSVADVDLLFTDTMNEARRLGRITLERNRQQLTIGASFGLKTLGLQVGDNVYITNSRFGWVNKAFEVLSWNFGLTDGLDLQTEMTLRETAEEVFDAVDDAAIYEADNTNLPSPFFVPVPSLDAAVITTTINEDGTAVPAIDFSWGVSNSEVVDYYDFQWKLSTDATYNSTVVEEPRFRIAPALSNVAYDYRVRAVNTLGIKSNYASSVSPASTGNDLTIPNPPTALVAEGGYSTVKLTWTPPTTNTDASTIRDLFQYQIFRGTTTNPTTFVGRVSGESFTDGGLADDTTYYYRVKAQDFTGNLSAYSANQSVTTEVAPTGARGAGRWDVGVTSLPTTSSGANTAFEAAYGTNFAVDRDQAWFYTGTVANPTSQGVWLYDADVPVWIEQEEVIDGNLLVTGTVTANAIDADAITGKNVTVGNLTTTTVPTGTQEGARIQQDGTMFVGDKNEYLRWDGSVLSINGEIVNLGDFNKSPYSGGWSSFSANITLDTKFNQLGGAGTYRIFMAGGGSSGSASGRTAGVTSYGKGGTSGAGALFTFVWNGTDTVAFTSGSGGAGVVGGGSGNASANNGVDGNAGGASLFKLNGSTKVTCAGGVAPVSSTSSRTSGPSAPSNPSDSRISEFSGVSGGDGGSGSGSGGGGVTAFNVNSTRGGDGTSSIGAAGGGPFGRGGSGGGPATPEDNNGFTLPVSGRLISSSSGYFSGPSGNLFWPLDISSVISTPSNSTGFLGGAGAGSTADNRPVTAGGGGMLAGGGGCKVSGDSVATAGDGGPSGGGGGVTKNDNSAGDLPISGDGGNGIIFFKKL